MLYFLMVINTEFFNYYYYFCVLSQYVLKLTTNINQNGTLIKSCDKSTFFRNKKGYFCKTNKKCKKYENDY